MGGVVDAITGGGARKAADAQVAAIGEAQTTIKNSLKKALDFQREALDKQQTAYDEALAFGEPYRDAGLKAMATYESLIYGVPVDQTETYKTTQEQGIDIGFTDPNAVADYTKTPGYQFRLDEGQKALERSAAAKSGLLSGAQLKATERYAQDYATGEFDKFLGRVGALSDSGAQFSSLAAGQTQALGNAQTGILSNMSELQTRAGEGLAGLDQAVGQARAGGFLGTQQAGGNILNLAAGLAGQSFGGGSGGYNPSLGSQGASSSFSPKTGETVYWS